MSAIVSDRFRILNAETFVGIITSAYTFIAQPNSSNPEVGNGTVNWGNGPDPRDSVDEENRIKETIIALKKITTSDVRRVIRKNKWIDGQIYEMYRHDYSVYNLSPITNSSSLYESNYYVINDDYRVYICLNNGVNSENPLGQVSLDQPTFVDLEPRPAGTSGDGYIWKYLYTLNPLDIVKFDTDDYIPTPESWGSPGTESLSIKNNAISGKIESVTVRNAGNGYPASGTFTGIPILGDGEDGEVTIVTNSFGEVSEVFVSNGGSGYTKGVIKFEPGAPGVPSNLSNGGTLAQFDVIIPPKGGHGFDIYNELGAYRAMVYSRFETDAENPDVIVGNDFATVGIINKPIVLNNSPYASGLGGLKLTGSDSVNYTVDEKITQTIGVGKTAVGYVASWDSVTKVLRYYQPAGAAGSSVNYTLYDFTSSPESGGSLAVFNSSSSSLNIDTSFDDTFIQLNSKVYQLGSNYTNGVALSEYTPGSGDIIYIDNRQPITRSLNQKEDIKIIIEF